MKRSAEEQQRRRLAWLEAAVTTAIIVMVMRATHEGLMVLLLPVLAAPLLRWRLRVGGWVELSLAVLIVLVAFVAQPALTLGLQYGGVLGPFAGEIMLSAMGLLVLRGWLRQPHRGIRLTLTLALLAATAAGGARLGWLYPALCGLCIGLGLLALREADPVRAKTQGWRLWRPGGVLVFCSAICGAALTLSLPPLYEWATDELVSLMDYVPRIGFTEGSMELGSLEGVWQSDEVVMRLRGPVSDPHLRGSVHRRYRDGRWAAESAPSRRVAALEPDPGQVVSVTVVKPERGPLFLPLGALPLPGDAVLRRDGLGIVRDITGAPPNRYRYQVAEASVWPPEPVDLSLPATLRAPLAELITGWQLEPATQPRRRIETLVSRLEQDYIYSLEHRRSPGVDPVLDFLSGENRLGHCEYFASALVLLSRSAGVPARVVRGFRIAERNRWLDEWVVRTSHAHAWAEVWLDGAWELRDPAPQRSLAEPLRTQTPLFAALLDALAYGARWLWQALWATGPALVGTLIGLWIIKRLWPLLQRLWGRRRASGTVQSAASVPPLWLSIQAALQQQQIKPRSGETLEQLARRVEQQSLHGGGLARLLRRYSAWRYGGLGDERSLQQALEQHLLHASRPG